MLSETAEENEGGDAVKQEAPKAEGEVAADASGVSDEAAKDEEKKADADAAKKADEAKKVIELEREKALNDLQASVTGLAMTAAAKLLSEQSSPENDRKRYQTFLASAGEKHD